MPGARWFPDARLNWAEHCLRLAQREGDDTVVIARSQTRDRVTLTADELREAVARAQGRPRPAGRGSRRSGRGLPAERARGGGRAARHRLAGCDLVELRARVRHAERGRSVQPDRAEGASDDRRLPVRRPGGRPSRRGGGHPRRAPEPGGDRRAALSPPVGRSGGRRADLGGAGRRAGRAGIRAGPVRPSPLRALQLGHHRACRSRSSTATAGSCSSISRSTRCTTTSGRPIGSSGSAPPAG